MEETKGYHPGQQAIITALQTATSDYERKQNYDKIVAHRDELLEVLELVLLEMQVHMANTAPSLHKLICATIAKATASEGER